MMDESFKFESVRKVILTFYLALNMLHRITEIFLTKFQETALKTFNEKKFSSKKNNINMNAYPLLTFLHLLRVTSCVILSYLFGPNDVW